MQEIPLSELHPFEGHPFRVVDDEDMMKTVESVRDFGVLTPAIVRPDPDGGYEIISGHRRHRASELAGKETMPVIVRDMDDDAAIILMVDANLQRETILPSERAYAYKMKLDALKHQGARSDLTSAQLGQKSWAVNQVAEQSGDSRVQVQRYIRLTELIPELLDMVDNGQIKLIRRWNFLIWQEKNSRIFFLLWTLPRLRLHFHRHRESKNSHRRASVRWTLCARL